MKITLLFALLVLITPAVSAQKVTHPLPAQIDFFNQMRFGAELQLVEENPCSPVKGRVLSIQESNYNNAVQKQNIQKGKPNHTTFSSFDMSGFRQSVVLQIGKDVDTIKFDYYEDGGYLNKIHRSDYDKPLNDVSIQYDSNHRVLSESVSNETGLKTGEASFTYNTNGSLKEIVFGTIKWDYSYTATGYSIHEDKYFQSKLDGSAIFTFKGQYLTQITYFVKNNKKYEVTKFDEKGNIVEDNIYSSDGKLDTKKIYRYLKSDSKGNWIVRTIYDDISMGLINSEWDGDLQLRTIQYYN